MEEKEITKFSWTAFFLVTGLSFFTFGKILQFLDGTPLPVFSWTGVIACLVGFLNSIRNWMEKTDSQ